MADQPPRLSALRSLQDAWGKYRIWATRALLVVILLITLLAQFLRPVQDLLDKGKYLGTGLVVAIVWIVFDTILSYGTVQPTVTDQSIVLGHYTDLREHLRKAFASDEVELDIAAYSGETVYHVLNEFLQSPPKDGPLNRLSIRLLVPDTEASMAVPCLVGSLDIDPTYMRDVRQRGIRIHRYFQGYQSNLAKEGITVNIKTQIHHFSPIFKFVSINRTVGFFGIYRIEETPAWQQDKQVEVWDYKGDKTHLVRVGRSGNAVERELYSALQGWFDTVWLHLSTAMP
jgi:hypothetical protein